MAQQSGPTEAQLNSFMEKLHTFRESLGDDDKKLLDAMYQAAMGHDQKTEEVSAYWVAAGPRGVAVGGAAGFYGRPWGAAYAYPAPYPYYY